MGLPTKPFALLSFFLLFSTNLVLIPLFESAADYTTLIYKGCAKQALSDPTGVYSQALSTLYGSLISQSSNAKFYQTTTGNGKTTISGLFQCRGDLSNVDCYNCVSNLPILTDKLCGTPVAARIQLLGCYMLYEISGFTQASGLDLLYKSCSGKNKAGSGFEEKRDTALSQLENGIGGSGSHGFFTTSYGSVYVLGQCEGDLGSSDCGDCVSSAVQRSQVECGSSISGQVYLNKCFISYSYGDPNGLSSGGSDSSSSSSGGRDSSSSSSSSSSASESESSSGSSSSPSGSDQNTQKTVAIIIGGTVGVGFLVICLMVVRHAMKNKHDDY